MASHNIDVGKGLTVIISATIVLMLVGTVLASGIGAFNSPDDAMVEQNTTESYTLVGNLTGTLDSVDDTAGTATVTVEDTDVGESQTVTIDEGTNETVTIDGEDVTVTANTVNTDSAELTYEWPNTYSWADGASALFGILDLITMLIVFLLLVGWVLTTWN